LLHDPGTHHEGFFRDHVEKHEVQEAGRHEREYEYPTWWSPLRITVTYVNGVAIGLAIIEMTERVELKYLNGKYVPGADYQLRPPRSGLNERWTSTQDLLSGRLRLVAYSPYRDGQLVKQWQETRTERLSGRIGAIVKQI
jgi:hypothetical protein